MTAEIAFVLIGPGLAVVGRGLLFLLVAGGQAQAQQQNGKKDFFHAYSSVLK